MKHDEAALRQTVADCLMTALLQICAGSKFDWDKTQLRELVLKSITFPNKKIEHAGGKPHDIEIRVALALFHRWRRKDDGTTTELELISDLGLSRTIGSPLEMAQTICKPLETAICETGIAHDVRCTPSGIITVVTQYRSKILRDAGTLPCPYCTQWLKGEKGLWWHQQQTHSIEHSDAAGVAASSSDSFAMVPYDPNLSSNRRVVNHQLPSVKEVIKTNINDEDPFEVLKRGDLNTIKKLVKVRCHGLVSALVFVVTMVVLRLMILSLSNQSSLHFCRMASILPVVTTREVLHL
jgi:hypothetical protein